MQQELASLPAPATAPTAPPRVVASLCRDHRRPNVLVILKLVTDEPAFVQLELPLRRGLHCSVDLYVCNRSTHSDKAALHPLCVPKFSVIGKNINGTGLGYLSIVFDGSCHFTTISSIVTVAPSPANKPAAGATPCSSRNHSEPQRSMFQCHCQSRLLTNQRWSTVPSPPLPYRKAAGPPGLHCANSQQRVVALAFALRRRGRSLTMNLG